MQICIKGGGSVDARQVSLMFKALSDEARVNIIYQLMEGEQCACNLLKKQKLTQPTLSYHMQILCKSGLVESRRIGRWTHYALSSEGMTEAQKIVQMMARATQTDPFENPSCC